MGPVALARPSFCFGENPARALVTPLQSAAMVPSSTSTSTSTSSSTSYIAAVYAEHLRNPRHWVRYECSPQEHSTTSTSTSTPVLRRSARLQQQALNSEDQMPGLISPPDSPPDSPPAPALRPMRGYPSWPSWYDSLSPHFALHASETSAEHPGTNCVERALLHGALSVARRDVGIADQRDLILHMGQNKNTLALKYEKVV